MYVVKGVGRPQRGQLTEDQGKLIALQELGERPSKEQPSALRRTEIEVLPSLFQPRASSLTYAPGLSQNHVSVLARAVRDTGSLDPVAVVAFGPQWFLIDGHHRLAAYRVAGFRKLIPVQVFDSDARGLARVHWAEGLSVELNHKDKLAMSADDKFDSAWRLVVSGGLTRPQIISATGVRARTVANMRAAKKTLLAVGSDGTAFSNIDELHGWSWSAARAAERKAKGGLSDDEGRDVYLQMVRNMAKMLTPVFRRRVDPEVLFDALEAYSPGLCTSLGKLARDRADERAKGDELFGDGDLSATDLEI